MRQETAIVFTATFIGVVAAVFTFNSLIEHGILPSKTQKIAELQVEPEIARVAAAETAEAVPTVASVHMVKLADVVEKALDGSTGKYGIAIKNLKTGETFFKDETTPFESASIYKLWVMGTTYKQIKEGKLKEDDVMSADVKVLHRQFGIASESAEMAEGTVSFNVSTALKQMITISHNYAALLLSSKVKLANVKAWLEENQFTASKTGSPPKTNAADTLAFFEKLYRGQLVDKESADKMLILLKAQRLNHKLPKYLPKDIVVAHKTGELGGVTHDAGIVYTDKGDYIVVVLSESKTPKGAEERIANISKDVYAYFAGK